jgi:hypothetical protein
MLEEDKKDVIRHFNSMLFDSQQPYHYERTNVKVIVLCPGLTDKSVFENLPQSVSDTDILQNHQR